MFGNVPNCPVIQLPQVYSNLNMNFLTLRPKYLPLTSITLQTYLLYFSAIPVNIDEFKSKPLLVSVTLMHAQSTIVPHSKLIPSIYFIAITLLIKDVLMNHLQDLKN